MSYYNSQREKCILIRDRLTGDSGQGLFYIEADLLRRKYFRKFTKDTIFQFKRKFTDGCKVNSSLVGEEIEQLNQMIVSNLAYAFPKSHSLSYSIIAYWSAYYKTHFPRKFESVYGLQK